MIAASRSTSRVFHVVFWSLLVLEATGVALLVHGRPAENNGPPPLRVLTPAPVVRSAPREFHVSPSGHCDNDGSAERPLDLATALSRKSPARPGDTIWLHGGIYSGTFESVLTGTPGAVIVVRQFPGERATIDSSPSSKDALLALGGWTWYWDFEVTNSDPNRFSAQKGSWPDDLGRGGGITARGPGLKFINLVVHDVAGGFGIWDESVGTEAYGNLVYYNGWYAPDRGHGHGIYTQNSSPSKRALRENIIFSQFSHGIHAYGSERAYLDNIELTGNVSFNNGAPAGDFARDILVGGGRIAHNPVILENFTYGGAQTNIGYFAGCENGLVRANYFAALLVEVVNCKAQMYQNIIYSPAKSRTLREAFPENTYYDEKPSGVYVRVRPNRYEPGRAHIVVYNWDQRDRVPVALGRLCGRREDQYEIRDAQNFFAPPVAAGRCGDGNIELPMAGLVAAAAVGAVPVQPKHTGPEFGVFVLLRTLPRGASAFPSR
jgi:hypothetical protein